MRSIRNLSFGSGLALLAAQSQAAVPAAVTTAIDTVGTDLGTVIAALTVIGATVFAAVAVYKRFFKV